MNYLQLGVLSLIASLFSASISLPVAAETSSVKNRGVFLKENHSAKTVKEWLAQVEETKTESSIQVIGVKLNQTKTGLEIVLETQDGKPLAIDASKFRTEGNSLIADIPNAVLMLPDGQPFAATNPTKDVTNISVTQQDPTSIRVSVAGDKTPPKTEVVLKVGELAYSLNPDDETDEEIVVRGDRAPRGTTASKTDTPILDIPASIQVIPREVLQNQGAVNLDQGIRNVSGVQQGSQGNYGFANTYVIRGLNQAFLRDGIPDGLANNGYFRTLTDVERIEVLKGPGSALYGSLSPGGVINLISKQPQADPFYAVEAGVGSFGFYRGAIDLTGPLTADKRLLYRFNAAYQHKDGFRDLRNQTIEVLPTLTWKPNDFNTITFDFDYRQVDLVADTYGTPFRGFDLLNVSRDLKYYTPFADTSQTLYRGAISYEWKINPNLLLRNNVAALFRDLFLARNASGGLFTGPRNDVPLDRILREQTDNALDFTYQTELVWKVATGSVNHTVLAGFEYQHKNYDSVRDTIVFAPIRDPFNPVLEQSRSQRRSQLRAFDVNLQANYVSLYLQDQIDLSKQFKVRLGGRWDQFGSKRTGIVNTLNSTQTRIVSTVETDLSNSPSRFSYQAGLVYQPIPQLSFYGGTSKSHFGAFSTEGVGDYLDPPESALQYEVGVKGELFDGKLNINLALFDVKRKDFIITINSIRQPVGAQKTRGLEFDLSAEPLAGWKITANYALYDAKLTNLPNTPLLEGNRPNGTPANAAFLWTTYQVQTGALKGFGFGGGITYRDIIFQNQENNRVIPAYTTLDLALFYRQERFEVQLNFNNVTNVEYFRNGVNTGALPGEPFNVQASVRYKF